MLDFDGPFFNNLSAENFEAFLKLAGNLISAGVLWVTKPAHLQCDDPRYSMVMGMARTIRTELGIDFATVELDDFESKAYNALIDVYKKFRKRRKNQDINPEYEFAVLDGQINISRYHWISTAEYLSEEPNADAPKRLIIGRRGHLDSLKWCLEEEVQLMPEQVEVEMGYVGVNLEVKVICISCKRPC